jgi:hypothetical protein
MLPAPLPGMRPPSAEVVASRTDPATEARTIHLHLNGTSPSLRLFIPGQVLLGWSASSQLPPLPSSERRYVVQFEGVQERGVDFQFVVRGTQPVEVELCGLDGTPVFSPEMNAVRKQLPDWATLHSFSYRVTRLSI